MSPIEIVSGWPAPGDLRVLGRLAQSVHLKPSGPVAARKFVLQSLENALPLARDLVENSHGEVHDLPVAKARSVYPEPVPYHLLNSFVLFGGDRAHVAHRITRVTNEPGLRDKRLVAHKRVKVILPVVLFVHDP
jgi:hypothetical protein